MEDKEEIRRRQAVLEVMKLKIKGTAYNPQVINQRRKQQAMKEQLDKLQQKTETTVSTQRGDDDEDNKTGITD